MWSTEGREEEADGSKVKVADFKTILVKTFDKHCEPGPCPLK